MMPFILTILRAEWLIFAVAFTAAWCAYVALALVYLGVRVGEDAGEAWRR
jgi:hypothetical protein